jgi:hypothetical protein
MPVEVMRATLVILAIFLSTNFALCADADRKQADEGILAKLHGWRI